MSPGRVVWGFFVMLAAACSGFHPPTAEALKALKPMLIAEQLPRNQFVVELESSFLSGVFDAVCLLDGDDIRLQLFPDVGGKVLDLDVSADGIRAVMPGASYQASRPLDRASPHLALVLAMMLAEVYTPPLAHRVNGERVTSNGRIQLSLEPALGSGFVVVTLTHGGRIQNYRMELGQMEWILSADGRFVGPGFAGRLGQ